MNNLQELIIQKINSLELPNSVIFLKGFNYWLDKIDRPFLFQKSVNLAGTEYVKSELPQKIREFQDNSTVFALYEDYIAMSDRQLGTILSVAFGKKTVILENDLFRNLYPNVADPELQQTISAALSSSEDHPAQIYYSDAVEGRDLSFIIYNDSPKPPDDYQTIKLSEILSTNDKLKITNQEVLDFPENYDETVLANTIAEIILHTPNEISFSKDYADNDGFYGRLNRILSPLGIIFTTREYLSQYRSVIDFELADEYLEILHRKIPGGKFKDLDVYAHPQKDQTLTKVNQIQIIDDIVQSAILALDGQDYQDVFVTAPTGAGKSIMFQIPAIYLAEQYNLVTIIISPLIGLMNDQVLNIGSMTNAAATINSDYTPAQKEAALEDIKNGNKSILYLSPEALLANSDIVSLIGERQIGLVVVDEAHIVATWGKSFRPDYWLLGEYTGRLRRSRTSRYNFPIATFTATATIGGDDNMKQEITTSLRMNAKEYIGNVRRSDIVFDIKHCKSDHDYAQAKLDTATKSILETATKDKTLIYVPYTSQARDLTNRLEDKIKIGKYYGKLSSGEKNDTLISFRDGELNAVVATKAFGMGIDIDDIKYVYHFAPTGNIADYVQEIGRAARKSGLTGIAKTDFFERDFRYINMLHGMSRIRNDQVIGVLSKLHDLYLQNRRRNFMVTPEDFSYIFPDIKLAESSDISSRLINTLLIIQRDFEHDYRINYKPIIFRPQGMFTKGYFQIHNDFLPVLRREGLMQFFKIIKFEKAPRVSYYGDIFCLNFKELWESSRAYRDMSFGKFKHDFFTGELPEFNFEVNKKLFPLNIIEIESNILSLNETRVKLHSILERIQKIFNTMFADGKFYKISELKNLLLEAGCVKDRYSADSVANSIIPTLENVRDGELNKTEKFHEEKLDTVRIVRKTYESKIQTIKSVIDDVLSHPGGQTVECVKKSSITGQNKLIVSQLLELFELAKCKILAGNDAEIFIRINNDQAIDRILHNPYYHSYTVKSVKKKHEDSCRLMQYFFTELEGDKERWDFIEKYFLGQIDADKIALEPSDSSEGSDGLV